ncbi:MAG: sulfotransferase [Tepidisphaeraceae bacterium]
MSDSPTQSGPLAICVLGMHRSGTSALSRLLNQLGVDLGRNLLPADFDNPRGFFELRAIVDCHTDLLDAIGSSYFDDFLPLPPGWETRAEVQPYRGQLLEIVRAEFADKPLWGFKDPRTCRLLPLWHDVLQQSGAQSRFVIMVRNPQEIFSSLSQRNGTPCNQSLLSTLVHMLQTERDTRGRRRVVVSYDELISDWRGLAAKIGNALGIQWPHPPEAPDASSGKGDEAIDPALRHHRAAKNSGAAELVEKFDADPEIAHWTFGVYDCLVAAAANPTGAVDEASLDKIHDEFQSAASGLAAWRPRWSMEERLRRALIWAEKMDGEIHRLSKENQEMRHELATRPALTQALARLAAAQGEAIAANGRADAAENRATAAENRASAAEDRATVAEQRTAAAEYRATAAEHVAEDLRQSASWKLTGPVRALGGLLSKPGAETGGGSADHSNH